MASFGRTAFLDFDSPSSDEEVGLHSSIRETLNSSPRLLDCLRNAMRVGRELMSGWVMMVMSIPLTRCLMLSF